MDKVVETLFVHSKSLFDNVRGEPTIVCVDILICHCSSVRYVMDLAKGLA